MRLIDADQFLVDETEAYMNAQLLIPKEEVRVINSMVHKKIQMLIMDAPTVNVPDKKVGKWEDIKYYNATYHCGKQGLELQMIEARCSSCGLYSDFESNRFNNIVNFCPHCGADMRTSDNDKTSDKASSCADCKHSKRLLFCTHPARWLHEVDPRNFCDELERGAEDD